MTWDNARLLLDVALALVIFVGALLTGLLLRRRRPPPPPPVAPPAPPPVDMTPVIDAINRLQPAATVDLGPVIDAIGRLQPAPAPTPAPPVDMKPVIDAIGRLTPPPPAAAPPVAPAELPTPPWWVKAMPNGQGLCARGIHDWQCVSRVLHRVAFGPYTEKTGWRCFRCGLERSEECCHPEHP